MRVAGRFSVIVCAAALHYSVMIPVQLEYTAPTGCPTQAEFVAFVANRGGDFAHPAPKTKARTMIVSLRREASEHTGSLELRLDDMASDARQLHAASCTEVAEALAVVAAIALRGADEGPATVDAQPAPSPAPEPVAAAAPSLIAPPAQPSSPSTEAPDEARLRSAALWGNEELSVAAGPLKVKRILATTLSGGVVVGAIPGVVLPRYDLTLTSTNFITTPQRTSHLIGGVFGVRWSYLGNATHHSGSYATEMNGFKAGVLGCTSLTYDANGFVALFCSGFMLGLLHLETKDTASAYRKADDVGFGAATIELNARYNFGKYVHVGLAVGGDFWVGKLAAQRADSSELFHSRFFNGNAQLGLGLNF